MTFDTLELKPVDWRLSLSSATLVSLLTAKRICLQAAIPGDTPGALATNRHPGLKDNNL